MPTPAANAYPILRAVAAPPSVAATAEFEPHIEAARFMTPVLDVGGTAVVRLRGRDLDCGALRCAATTPGFTVELLPMCTKQGDEMLIGLRIARCGASASQGCEVRFQAADSAAHATVMVRR